MRNAGLLVDLAVLLETQAFVELCGVTLRRQLNAGMATVSRGIHQGAHDTRPNPIPAQLFQNRNTADMTIGKQTACANGMAVGIKRQYMQ